MLVVGKMNDEWTKGLGSVYLHNRVVGNACASVRIQLRTNSKDSIDFRTNTDSKLNLCGFLLSRHRVNGSLVFYWKPIEKQQVKPPIGSGDGLE